MMCASESNCDIEVLGESQMGSDVPICMLEYDVLNYFAFNVDNAIAQWLDDTIHPMIGAAS